MFKGIARRMIFLCLAISFFLLSVSAESYIEYFSIPVYRVDSDRAYPVTDFNSSSYAGYFSCGFASVGSGSSTYYFDMMLDHGNYQWSYGEITIRYRVIFHYDCSYESFNLWMYKKDTSSTSSATGGVLTTYVSPNNVTFIGYTSSYDMEYEAEWTIPVNEYMEFDRVRLGTKAASNNGLVCLWYGWKDIEIEQVYSDRDYVEAVGSSVVSAIDRNRETVVTAIDNTAIYIGDVVRNAVSYVADAILHEDFGYTEPSRPKIEEGLDNLSSTAGVISDYFSEFGSIRTQAINELDSIRNDVSNPVTPIWSVFTGVILVFFVIGVVFLCVRKALGR